MEKDSKALLIGFYIKPTWKRPTKGCVWSVKAICPCLNAGMGGVETSYPQLLRYMIIKLGKYIDCKFSNRANVYSVHGGSPTLQSAMGGWGGIASSVTGTTILPVTGYPTP